MTRISLSTLTRAGGITLAIAFALPVRASGEEPAGKAIYDKLCASCHAADGKGNPDKAKSLRIDPSLLNLGRPETGRMSRDELRTVLLKGKNKMPAYEKKLKPPEIDPVLDYSQSLAQKLRGQ